MPRQSAFRSEVLAEPTPVGVIAAATNYTIGKPRRVTPGSSNTLGEAWQDTVWDFYDVVSELRYSADFVGNLLSKAKLYPTYDGKPTDNEFALQAMRDLYGGPEGQSEMLKALGIHYTVAGECILVGLTGENGDEWFVVAPSEAKQTSNTTFIINDGKIVVEKKKSVAIRMWHEHPRKPWKANSPARACIPILAELVKLTQHVAAQIDSRLTSAGILWVPSEMSFPSTPVTQTDEEGVVTSTASQAASSGQALSDILTEVASIAIRDREDAAALVPIIVQVAGEFLDKVNKTEFWTGLDEKAIELRTEAIRRFALGMDMPPEILTGTADVNHWGAWAVDESAIKAHSEPLLSGIVYALTTGYLRKVLAFDLPPEEVARYGIWADTSGMRVRPNRSKEAIELYDRGELSGAAMLRENGFEMPDAMDDVERISWLTKKLAQGQTTPELVAEGLRILGVNLPDALALPDTEHQARPDRSVLEHPVRDLPEIQDSVPEPSILAAEVMVFRALERAGNRVKNRPGIRDTGFSARELYRALPQLSEVEIDDLLVDAWSCTEWTDLGIDAHALALCLDGYTRTLLATRKPHERALLRQHLGLALTLQPMNQG